MLKFVGFNENTILEVVDVGCREDRKWLTDTRVLNLLVQEGHSSHFLLTFFDPDLPELGVLDGREGAPVLVTIIVHIIDDLVGVFLVNGSLVGIVFGVMMAPKFLLFAHDLLLLQVLSLFLDFVDHSIHWNVLLLQLVLAVVELIFSHH